MTIRHTHRRSRLAAALLASTAFIAPIAAAAAPIAPDVDPARLEAAVRELASAGSRIPGSVGSSNAFERIHGRLEEILGPDRVVVQEFDIAVPDPEEPARLEIDGAGEIAVDALWPNAGVPPRTPRGGLHAPLVYAPSLAEIDGARLDGAIIVQEFDAGDLWVRLAGLGARAVVFLPPDRFERTVMERAILSAPLFFPRYMVRDPAVADALRAAARAQRPATLHGSLRWRTATGHNVIGLLPGHGDPALAAQRVVLSAYFDSISAVPARAPGAEAAGNAAALLETARWLADEPPQRTTLFVFTDAHFLGMSGAANFTRWFSEANTDYGHRRKLISLPLEEEMLRKRLPEFQRLATEFPGVAAVTNMLASVEDDLAARPDDRARIESEIEVLAVPEFATDYDRAEAHVAVYQGVRDTFRDMAVLGTALGDIRTRIRDLRLEPELRDQPGAADEIARCRAARARILDLQDGFEKTPDLDRLVADAKKDRPRRPLFHRISDRERARRRSPVLFVGFDLTSGSPKTGLFIRGSYDDNRDIYRQREYVGLGRALRARVLGSPEMGRPGLGDLLGAPPESLFTETITGTRGTSAESHFSEPFAFESELVAMAFPAVTLATCGDARSLVDTPGDLPEHVDYGNLALATRTTATIARILADDPEIDLRIYEGHRLYPAVNGRAVRLEQAKSLVADTAVPNTVLLLRPERGSRGAFMRGFPKPLYGVHAEHVALGDDDGAYSFPGFLWTGGARLEAFVLDEETGRIRMAHDLGGEGDRKYNFSRIYVPSRSALPITTVLFDCAATALVDLVDPRYLLSLQYLQILDGRTDAEPQFFGYSLPFVPRFEASYVEPIVVVFTRPQGRFKLTMSLGLVGKRLVLVNAATPLIELGYSVRQALDRIAAGPDPAAVSDVPLRETPEAIDELFGTILETDPDELIARGVVPPSEEELETLVTARATFGELTGRATSGAGIDAEWSRGRTRLERSLARVIEEHKGSTYGFSPGHGVMPWVHESVARDLWYLNEERLSTLERHGIASEFLAGMHRSSRDALDRAEGLRDNARWGAYIETTDEAWALASRVYPDVIRTSNDVVKGVIFYLAMALPFAYFGERLFFAFADIRARIAGVVGVFLAVLLLLSFVHPAFAITMTPLLIFLGFIIITLAVVVTSLVMSKFNRELARWKSGMVALRHTDVNRFGAAMTAFNLGVSYMRRRRMKTTLTCVALVLLTFTVISFVSVQGYLRFNRYPLPWKCAYRGVLYRNLDWSPIEEPEYRRFRTAFDRGFAVTSRAWLTGPRPEEYLAMELSNADDPAQITQITGALGLEPSEIDVTGAADTVTAGRWFRPGDHEVCILPERLAESIGITAADLAAGAPTVRLFGERLRVIGLVRGRSDADGVGWDDLVDLNDDPISPASFVAHRAEQVSRDEETGTTAAALEEYDYVPATAIALLPFDLLMARGGTIRSIAAHPTDDDLDLDGFIEKLLATWSLAIYVADSPGAHAVLYNSIGASSLTGAGGMAIPLLIAGLIIFNTMLGSVYERQREIHTYSSVGLSPVHISSLFVAESCVYAVMGAIAGYLLGQAVAFVLTKQHWLAGLTLNYSSTSTFMAVAIVMATTVASSLYPASLAHRLATPDIARTWQTGDPTGDHWFLELPFIIDRSVALPFNAYLVDYFRAHREESVGHFCAENVRFHRGGDRDGESGDDSAANGGEVDNEGIGTVAFRCRLAPYDFGVQQDVELESVPSDVIDGRLTFNLRVERVSGDNAAWRRTNREFLNRLRKTILLWRVLSDRDKAVYYERTEDVLAGRLDDETDAQQG